MKKYYFLAIILVYGFLLFGFAQIMLAQEQNQASDQLNLDKLYKELIDTKGEEYIEKANNIISLTGDTAVFTRDMSRDKIQTILLKEIIFYYYNKEQYERAIRYAKIAISFFEKNRDSINIAGCCHTIAIAYQNIGKYDKAIENYYKCNDILIKSGNDPSGQRSRYTLNNIAAIHQHNKNYELAEKIYNQCLGMLNNQDPNEQNMLDRSNYLNNLSGIYISMSESLSGEPKQQKIDEAIKTAKEALDISRKFNDKPKFLTNHLITLSSAYIANGDYTKAISLLDEAQVLAIKYDLQYRLSNIYLTKARGEAQNGNRFYAELYYNKAYAIAEQRDFKELLQTITNEAYLYMRDSNPAKALEYFEKSVVLHDSIFSVETKRELNEFHVKYETAEKEYQIKLQKAKLQRKNFVQWVLLIGFILCLVILVIVNRYRQLIHRRNQELLEINATKDKFFSIISHDLKNPAIAQRNALKMLVDNGDKLDADSLTKYYCELLKTADMQVELLYSLLDWARVQTGRMPYNPTTFDIVESIYSELSLVHAMSESKNIEVITDIPSEALVYGDRNMVSTIVRNLLSNAVKFTNQGGEIKISLASINNHQYSITIADNGIGMDAERVKNLFRIDKQQSSAVGTAGEKGSGLGLIVCKELVERNGGIISVESLPGAGTTFCFTIEKQK